MLTQSGDGVFALTSLCLFEQEEETKTRSNRNQLCVCIEGTLLDVYSVYVYSTIQETQQGSYLRYSSVIFFYFFFSSMYTLSSGQVTPQAITCTKDQIPHDSITLTHPTSSIPSTTHITLAILRMTVVHISVSSQPHHALHSIFFLLFSFQVVFFCS